MAGNLTAMIASIFSGGVTPDPYYEYTTLLLPGNGTNGAQNNTFLDGSTNNFTITRNGNTTQGTFSPFSQTGWGNLFVSASSQYLSLSSSSFAVGTGAFTIEGWVYLNSYTYGSVFSTWNAANTGVGMMLGFDNTGKIQFSIGNASGSADTTIVTASSISLNTWVFLQATKAAGSGGAMTIYINGTSSATTTTTRSVDRSAAVIGRYYQDASGNQINGYLSNVRVSNTVRSSTVPTAPFTNDANTLLLTCQSNRFLDVSSTPITITPNGSPTVVAFSPFNPTASWSAATYGGSGYFDGSGDYLTVPDNVALRFGTGDFDIEFWYNGIVGPTNSQFVISKFTAGSFPSQMAYVVAVVRKDHPTNPRGISVYLGSTSFLVGSGNIQDNTWCHIAVTRESGSVKVFINGTQVGTTQTITNDITNTSTLSIGASNDATSLVTGYVSNVRIVKGSAVYTGNFTPPTAPLTAITNTSLLLNFTNAGVYDATSKNDLETVGNAQISTTQSKWGGSSMYFDGTGDYAVTPASPLNAFLTGDFTCEFWVYFNALATNQTVMGTASGFQTGGYQWIQLASNTLTFRMELTSGAINVATGALSTGQWYHIAATRSGTTVRVFVNGVLANSTTTGGSISDSTGNKVIVGNSVELQATRFFNGYLQDVRVTRGYARYTANFTPPTAAFPTL
jgi:hypothetical protein